MKLKKLICILLIGVLVVGTFVACTSGDSAEAETYVSLRINPEIELLADKNGEVISATAVNEDGEILLSVVDLEGKTIEEAGEIFTRTADELGYLANNGSNDTVYVDVQSNIEGEETIIKEKLNNKIRHYFNNNGINGRISTETLDKYADAAVDWGISVGHTKLVMRVLDACPELMDTDVIDFSVKELMTLLKGKFKVAAGLNDDYRASVKVLNADYSELFKLNKDYKKLEKLLKNNISEEEKEAVKTQLEEIEVQRKALLEEYNEKLDEIKELYSDKSEDARIKYREEAEKRKNK